MRITNPLNDLLIIALLKCTRLRLRSNASNASVNTISSPDGECHKAAS